MICFKFVIRAERKPGENKCIITTNRNGFFCGDPDRWAAKKKKKKRQSESNRSGRLKAVSRPKHYLKSQ